jgi:hypothetical protein
MVSVHNIVRSLLLTVPLIANEEMLAKLDQQLVETDESHQAI